MAFRKNKLIRLTEVAFISLALFACSNNDPESPQPSEQTNISETTAPNTDIHVESAVADSTLKSTPPLTTFYLGLASQQFNATCSSAEQLRQTTQQFVTSPDENGLKKIKSAWLASHSDYASTQLFRNINIQHPIFDQSTLTPVKHSLAVKIDQTPLLPGYIDEVKGYPKSGYIFSTLPIDRETLNKEHQFADSAYVSMGFHAVEFLLWGEDDRTHSDFLPIEQESDVNSDDLFKIRRSRLLSLTTTMLAEDIQTLCKEWNADTGFYAASLKALSIKDQNAAINAATEQLISSLQINTAKVRQANDNNEEIIEVVPHSAFSNSDKEDTQTQINILKSLIDSSEWAKASKKQEHTQKLSQLAKALLL